MDAEGTPHDSWLSRGLIGVARLLLLRHPVWTLACALLVAGLSIWLAATRLQFRPNRLDLLSPTSDYHARWLRYLREFGDGNEALVIVEGAAVEDVVGGLRELGARLEARPERFASVLYQFNWERLRAKGLYLMDDAARERLSQFVAAAPVGRGDWAGWNSAQLLLRGMQRWHAETSTVGRLQMEKDLVRLGESLLLAIDAQPAYRFPAEDWSAGWQANEWLVDPKERRGLMLVRLAAGKAEYVPNAAAIGELRTQIAHVEAAHDGLRIGLTGIPVLEHDEMLASRNDTTRASVLSLFGVGVLFVAGFGGVMLPLLAVGSLLIGVAWTLGFVTLTLGHLNLLSVAFGAILIGLGIDFGIHVVAGFQQHRRRAGTTEEALLATLRSVAPGTITGATTTAVAFLTASLTQFTGLAELGLITGGGVLLCLLSALTVLPALVAWVHRRRSWDDRAVPLPLAVAAEASRTTPRLVIVLLGLWTVATGLGLGWLRYDHNLLHLHPVGLDSVQWERRLLETNGLSASYAVSLSRSPEELLRKKAAFEKLATVERTESLAPLWLGQSPARQQQVATLRQSLERLPATPPDVVGTDPHAGYEELRAAVDQARQLVRSAAPSAVGQVLLRLDERLQAVSTAWGMERLQDFDQALRHDTWRKLGELRHLASQPPPQLDDIPDAWRSRLLGAEGTHVLQVYGRGDLWDMDQLAPFVRDLESVDPHVTGHPIQVYHASWQMQSSYVHAAAFALIAALIVLMVDFRSVRLTVLAMTPMALAVVQTLGLLGLFQIPLNPANLIVLPLILGIGLDDGVHVLHDFLRQRGGYRLSHATATAITITSATTMVGFGALMTASHQGLRSLGQVLTLGVFCCLINSLWVLPAVLHCACGRESQIARLLIPGSRWYSKVFG